ncbi:MAG: hypothetical protein GVY36_12925 [Verrucomicrobia bacterium]|jgi:hypothetical protein|nr:hypothetical protein [Verrucomicrobiota bacterium]
MESIDTEIYEDPGKRDQRGRRLLGADEWARILERYDQSGLTQAAFCRREGLRYGTLVAWLGRRRKNGGVLAGRLPDKPVFQELSVSSHAGTEGKFGLEVRLPDATLLRGSCASELARLVQLLRD